MVATQDLYLDILNGQKGVCQGYFGESRQNDLDTRDPSSYTRTVENQCLINPREITNRATESELSAVVVYESVVCDLCGGEDTQVLFTMTDRYLCAEGRFLLVRCKDCGLVYINPRPAKSSIRIYYSLSQYDDPPNTLTRGVLLKRFKQLVRESSPGYDQHVRGLRRLVGKLLGAFLGDRIGIVVPFIPNGRILDVGCNDGEMVGWMTQHGWETYGVEINPKASAVAAERGMKIFHGELMDAGYQADYFDAVTMNHVLEHVHSPSQILSEVYRVLKPGGMVFINVPNFGCFDAEIFREHWYGLDPPRHLYDFTTSTLSDLLRKARFELVRWVPKLPHSLYAYRSIELWREARNLSSAAKWKLQLQMQLVKPVLWACSRDKQRYSESMSVYARKKYLPA